MFFKIFKTIATLLVLISISAVTQARSLDEILKSGVLKGGVNPGLPPLAKYDDKNNLVGFVSFIVFIWFKSIDLVFFWWKCKGA